MANGSCAYCGEPVPRKRSKYCSRRCMGLDQKTSVKATCPCGVIFEVQPGRIADGRGKFCSKACQYANYVRPSGLTYNIKVVNRGWRKPGDRWSPDTEFRKGSEPWNTGLKDTHFSPTTEFKPGQMAGSANFRWVGGLGQRHSDRPGYAALHVRVRQARGPASGYPCAMADATCRGRMHWANISRQYLGVDDFMPLCNSHHVRYDGGIL